MTASSVLPDRPSSGVVGAVVALDGGRGFMVRLASSDDADDVSSLLHMAVFAVDAMRHTLDQAHLKDVDVVPSGPRVGLLSINRGTPSDGDVMLDARMFADHVEVTPASRLMNDPALHAGACLMLDAFTHALTQTGFTVIGGGGE